MRIAMVSTPFVPVPPHHYGGTELVVYELVEGLLDRGHEVTLFATGDSRTRAPLCSLYPSAQWPPGWFTDLNHSAWSLHQVAQDKFDVIHAHSAAALALGRFVPDTPMVYTLHHTHDPELSAYYEQFPEVAFVAISGDQCRRECGANRRTVIHHGLDPSRFRWTHQPGPYVCFVGRFAQEKGVHTAIDVAQAAGVPMAAVGQEPPPGNHALKIHVNGQQYIWRFDYVGKKPLDAGRPVYAYTDMYVPINTTVTLKIYSSDVIHSWWVPQLGGKADATPGHTNETWFKISKPGIYKGQCAELCGDNHADMRARVIALPVDQYQAWIEQHRKDLFASQAALAAARKSGIGDPTSSKAK